MVDDHKLSMDEARRMRELERVKAEAEKKVQGEVAKATSELTEVDAEHAHEIADRMKREAVHEVIETDREVATARFMARVGQYVDYAFSLAYGIIGLRILLELLGARQGTGFKQFVDTLSAPLLLPFRGLLVEPKYDIFVVRTSYLMALLVFLLLHAAVRGLLYVFAHRSTRL